MTRHTSLQGSPISINLILLERIYYIPRSGSHIILEKNSIPKGRKTGGDRYFLSLIVMNDKAKLFTEYSDFDKYFFIGKGIPQSGPHKNLEKNLTLRVGKRRMIDFSHTDFNE